ncbi:MAG: two-component system sensor histidine kinase NtrB [Planctomycetota bacterium]
MLHALLKRHLARLDLCPETPPNSQEVWEAFLQRVSRAYAESDDGRYLMERSLAISSAEMANLHQSIAEQRDRLETIVSSLAEGMLAVDADGTIQTANFEAERLLQVVPGSAVGRPWAELFSITCEADFTRLVIEGGTYQTEDATLVRADQSTLPISFILSPLKNSEITRGAVVAFRDISERRRAEQAHAELNRRLVEAGRLAGMAEVATGVLHNVGNVLNSVNVSVSMLAQAVRESQLDSLRQGVGVLEAHRADLSTFISEDPQGKHFLPFLVEICADLTRERESLSKEIEGLAKHVEHVKQVISMQQKHARLSTVCEESNLAELLDDALQLCGGSFEQRGIDVTKDYDSLPAIIVDKHKLMQIVVNLIRNASDAVLAADIDRRIQIRLRREQDGPVCIEVGDNGVGIPRENLTRIFSHGFTTKEAGHGFGLHSCALSAKELGGALRVTSDGIGRGARFTLEIPYAAAVEEVPA